MQNDELIGRLEAVKVGERISIPKHLHGLSFHYLFARGQAAEKCDRFEVTPPTGGRGFTGGMWHIFGYQGADCMFVSALPLCPIAALRAQGDRHE